MLCFTSLIQKFERQGEKTGWTYILISEEQAALLNPGVRTTFRVKGKLDAVSIEKIAVMPMGDGSFIMPLNATLRKALRKEKGATLSAALQVDREPLPLNADFLECLRDEPAALKTFDAFPKGHQTYFSRWIDSAKTEPTRAKRIAMAINALAKGWGYSEMIRAAKKEKAAWE